MSDPVLTDLLGSEASAQAQIYLNNPDYREYLEYAPIKFQADGMSRIAQRMHELDKVMAFINLLGNAGKAIPQILQQVNWRELIEVGVYAMDWDVSKILTPAPGEIPQAPVPGMQDAPRSGKPAPAVPPGGGPDRSPAPPGMPETAGTVPGMASLAQGFQGFKGQNETPELNGG